MHTELSTQYAKSLPTASKSTWGESYRLLGAHSCFCATSSTLRFLVAAVRRAVASADCHVSCCTGAFQTSLDYDGARPDTAHPGVSVNRVIEGSPGLSVSNSIDENNIKNPSLACSCAGSAGSGRVLVQDTAGPRAGLPATRRSSGSRRAGWRRSTRRAAATTRLCGTSSGVRALHSVPTRRRPR